ncbi:von Willebrand factor type A [Ignisphaera aggregans DSM 17230]|uniref:von Willebrand factor type A n=1 Tax=Ignisphaera aggregans (strain DSM 17230 / JCM 13409 / AQ1.S1) TaxID=583356 RepID=E0SQJ1_IGNAA|nr:von Willebrand factor type A [Ignisphaera aggregans DSM 17230]
MPGVLKNIDYQDPFTRYKGQKIIDNIKKFKHGLEYSIDLAIDIYYSLYLPFPRILEPSALPIGAEKHYEIIKTLLVDEEAKALRHYTVADSFASVAIGTLFLINLSEEMDKSNINQQSSGEGKSQGAAKREQSEENQGEGSLSQDLNNVIKNAIRKTLDKAETIKEVESLVYGQRAGIGHTLNLDDDVSTVLRLVRNTDIKNILALLAKILDIKAFAKRKRVRYQRGEIEGYFMGFDVERIVPTELAYPSIYLYAKISEGNILLYDKILYMSLGPIYVLLDKSGSMDGNKILWAKATALALFMKSRIERRPYYIRFFDSEPYDLIKVKSGAKPSEVMKLIEYIAMVRNGGGTDISKAIITACNDILRNEVVRDVSDIIIITDGEDRIAKSLVRKSLQHAKAKLISVMVMGENDDLKQISSKYLKVVKLTEKDAISVIESTGHE